jgi:hypothetical protein
VTEGLREHGRLAGGASTRPTTWLAWSLWMVIMISGATLLFPLDLRWNWYVLTHYFYRYPEDFTDVLTSGILILAVPAYATVGAIVVSLRSRNGVGWLCLVLSYIVVLVSWQPAYGSMPALANGLAGLAWVLIAPPLPVTLVLLIFPDGRLLSRRWWWVVGMALVWPVLGPLVAFYQPYPSVELVRKIGFSISVVALLASVVAIVLRSRRSRGLERQRIKLLVYAVTVTIIAVLLAVASSYVLGDIPGAQSPLSVISFVIAFGGIALGIPVAIGIAILRYRLYNIDTLINRTLVYGALTALLAAGYLGTIVALQGISSLPLQIPVRAITGQEQPSQLVVVVSTLAMAALFSPLRRRLQSFIDRRFYRRKYDAAKTLEGFSTKLRDETDLDALSNDLVGVVAETMQPAHVSLWVRPETASKGQQAE